STPAMPLSATLSMSSRISLKFNVGYLSNQLVPKQILRLRELVSGASVVPVGPQDEQDVVLGRYLGQECNVLLGNERELQHFAGVQLRIRVADRLDEASELRAEDVQRHVLIVDGLDGDAIEADQARGHRSL